MATTDLWRLAIYVSFSSSSSLSCRYGSEISSNGITGSITCLPMEQSISSRNVTAVTAYRGNSYVKTEDNLLSVDNNFRPYIIQMHPSIIIAHQQTQHFYWYTIDLLDILLVSPTSGSEEGGTRIVITLDHPLTGYDPDEVKVSVGG